MIPVLMPFLCLRMEKSGTRHSDSLWRDMMKDVDRGLTDSCQLEQRDSALSPGLAGSRLMDHVGMLLTSLFEWSRCFSLRIVVTEGDEDVFHGFALMCL